MSCLKSLLLLLLLPSPVQQGEKMNISVTNNNNNNKNIPRARDVLHLEPCCCCCCCLSRFDALCGLGISWNVGGAASWCWCGRRGHRRGRSCHRGLVVVEVVVVVVVVELAVERESPGRPEFKINHKSCDLLRVGSNDFGIF